MAKIGFQIRQSFAQLLPYFELEVSIGSALLDLPCIYLPTKCLIHLFSQFEIFLRPTQMDPFSQSLKLPTIHTSFTIKSQLPGLVAFGKNTDQTLMAKESLFLHHMEFYHITNLGGLLFPKRMNFRKISERPFLPFFEKLYCDFFRIFMTKFAAYNANKFLI